MSFALKQVAEHNNTNSCWVIIANKVYDVTDFLSDHPGGRKVILQYAGQDATSAYEPIHPPDALEKNLPPEKHLGSLSLDAQATIAEQNKNRKKTVDEERVERAQGEKPSIHKMLSLRDIESVARKVLPHKALAYYSSASDDEITYNENERAFARFFFNARVLRAISRCNPSTTILGFPSSIPVFVCGAALAKLGHPLGEACITLGAHKTGIIQMVSSNSSLSSGEISLARPSPSQPLFFQFYKNKNDEIAEKRVKEIEAQGYKAVFLTVDAIVAGNRERDLRAPFELEDIEKVGVGRVSEGEKPRNVKDILKVEEESEDDKALEFGGTAGGLLANDDVDMTWDEVSQMWRPVPRFSDIDMTWHQTIPWLRSITKLPIVLKGIQCVEDAVRAAEIGVDGIILSNHGGNSLPPMEVLYRLQRQRPDVFSKLEVYIDGGVRRGTDVIKALCLGAKAVGMGRPFLYALSAYGEAGVVKTVRILEREIVTGMRLLGVSSIKELTPEIVERVDWQPMSAKL